jgi:hypothetical protein
MNFVAKLLRGIAFVPAVVHGIETLSAGNAGSNKKEAALSFVTAALSVTEAISDHEIVDENKFKDGLGQVIDGVVQCLNASAWAKAQ